MTIIAEMKSSFVFFLLLCGRAVCQMREYIFINKPMSWISAQNYCRQNYVDLATITTYEENQRMLQTPGVSQSQMQWIGLNRIAPGSKIWQWSDREPRLFFNWAPGQPDNWNGVQSCAIVRSKLMDDAYCENSFPFYCSWRFVLVNNSKTWEEALEYCRTHYTGLASPVSPAQLTLAKNATDQTQTVRVWTGLRFMNGQWVSVNNVPLGSQVSLPSCPAPRYSCGAYNNNTHIWENRDCNEKLNFLCF